jgi:hypothetical protein
MGGKSKKLLLVDVQYELPTSWIPFVMGADGTVGIHAAEVSTLWPEN